ncbi:isoprenylcysteine carboxylmethyltransferase family protein [Candidatus Villigracilis saccharophilus]|uniref:methyltransferase family protein n=1 Tax=Candidatus Villigracilis saccharophilus TaxID=3140684 RepID=UPI0031353048|nr:isoprenylcysteine carboxylmethyltransferase family protein [Anaerolineales bacterium]
MPRNQLIKIVLSRLLMALPMFMLFFFLPAGTWNYWQAWVYLAILFIPMFFAMFYLLKNNPELLERRMRMKEKRSGQKQVVGISLIFLLLAFLLPGFDKRFGWSIVPIEVVVAAQICVLAGYLIVFRVMQINSFASRVIEVASEQTVIDTDLYAIVRHPMYMGAMVLYVMSPLALGSYWSVIPALGMIPILVARIKDEELMLEKELPGYLEYKKKTKYRLIPYVW